MMSTRRKFLLNCSAVAATASLSPGTAFGAAFRLKEISAEKINCSTFAAHLNTAFSVRGDSGRARVLRLTRVRRSSVNAGAPAAEDATNEKFSLLFRGSPIHALEQGTYWFEHWRMGRFAMFIVPAGSGGTRHRYYEAIFNRPVNGPLPRAGEGNIPVGKPRSKPAETERTSSG